MATQIDLGAVVPIGKGDWNPSTTYERANIVRHNSVAWICKVATSLGVEPTETSSDWYLLVKDTSSVTSVNGMRGDVTIDSVPENPSIDDNSLKIASTAWTNTKISQVDSKASTALQTANTANSTADNALSKAEEASNKSGLPLGHIYLWPFSTPPDGSIQLNGSTYSRELYSDLWNLIQTKGWYKPEAEWQSIASANGGYCPWYSDGDGSTTFRTPKFAPYQKLALVSSDAGKYYNAGLPDITGHFSATDNVCLNGDYTATSQVFRSNDGCFSSIDGSGARALVPNHIVKTYTDNRRVTFSASKSNGIYGNSDTVQPESNDWIVCVVAFGTATNVGNVDVANIMSAVNQVQSDVNEIQANPNLQGISHLIETWKSDDGISWYRKWSDGFIEQGGVLSKITNRDSYESETVVLFIPFTTTNYTVLITQDDANNTFGLDGATNGNTCHRKSKTSFVMSTYSWTYGRNWEAKGY